MGPVQVLVIGFDQPTFRGEALAELARLRDAGVVRLIDVLLVSRLEDGSFETLAAPPGMPEGLGELTAELLARDDSEAPEKEVTADADPSTQPAWSLADSMPVGSVAAVALIEHIWAGPLRDAIQRAGGVPLDETWLAPADLDSLETLISLHER